MNADPMLKPSTAAKGTTICNPFAVLANSKNADTKLNELFMVALGTAAIFQAAILLSNVVKERFEPKIDDAFGTRTIDDRNEEDATHDAEAFSNDVADDQGRTRSLTTSEAMLLEAHHLVAIRDYCADQAATLTAGSRFAVPTTMLDAIKLFCKGGVRSIPAPQQAAMDRMVDKGIFTKDEIEARRKQSAHRNAEQWADQGPQVYSEFLSLDAHVRDFDLQTGSLAEDNGASGMAEEAIGDHHFNQLSPRMAMLLWNKLIEGMQTRFKQFALNVAMEVDREYSMSNVESETIRLAALQEEMSKGRTAFYTTHRTDLTDDAGLTATPRPMVANALVKETADPKTKETVFDKLDGMARKSGDKQLLPMTF